MNKRTIYSFFISSRLSFLVVLFLMFFSSDNWTEFFVTFSSLSTWTIKCLPPLLYLFVFHPKWSSISSEMTLSNIHNWYTINEQSARLWMSYFPGTVTCMFLLRVGFCYGRSALLSHSVLFCAITPNLKTTCLVSSASTICSLRIVWQ